MQLLDSSKYYCKKQMVCGKEGGDERGWKGMKGDEGGWRGMKGDWNFSICEAIQSLVFNTADHINFILEYRPNKL